MRKLKSYEEALEVARDCIASSKGKGLKNPPEQVNGPWEQSVSAAEHTLKYIFEKLHLNCYMICMKDDPEVLKIEHSTTAPSFALALRKTHKNKKINLKTLKSKQWRVMQCIVKPYNSSESFEYPAFLKDIQLPKGVYILCISDAVILRKDGKEPFPMVTGLKSLGQYDFKTHLPILNGSGQQGYWDIPIPNYDDVRLVMGYDKINQSVIDWDSKLFTAVFRGGPTGCGYTPETNMRLKLATMRSELLDVGVTANKSNTMKFDPKEGLGMLDSSIKKVPFMDMFTEQAKHKYIIHVDGNVVAFRLLKSMLTGSLILRVKSDFIHWTDHLTKDGTHYISVKEDLSDLEDTIHWCIKNDKKCKKIAENGTKFAKKVLTKDFLQTYLKQICFSI